MTKSRTTKLKQITQFIEYWKKQPCKEKGETQAFWTDLLRTFFDIEKPHTEMRFEVPSGSGFIDALIPDSYILIEQKSRGKNLLCKYKQSDGAMLTPYEQAKRYIPDLPPKNHPLYIVTCNFDEFLIYDMNCQSNPPENILLEDLITEWHRLSFLVDVKRAHIEREKQLSTEAGSIVENLYNMLHMQYKNPDSEESLQYLNKLCVRLVFCLYADDALIFDRKNMFRDYLKQFNVEHMRDALRDIFITLNTPYDERNPYIADDLNSFPYVNGGLFDDSKEEIEKSIPKFTDECKKLLLEEASLFDWSGISPTIFGAIFESTLNPITRGHEGTHYTSIENIHKVIDPLFLDDLKAELDKALSLGQRNVRRETLEKFRNKLASLTFLDPACGSGNFLTLTYTELRKLENIALQQIIDDIKGQAKGQLMLSAEGLINPIMVSIENFYGIEIRAPLKTL